MSIVQELKKWAAKSPVSAVAFVYAYAGLGDVDQMINALEQLYKERHPEMVFLKAGDVYDPFRSDPRFVSLMKRVGLPTD